MFALLSKGTAKLLDVRVESAHGALLSPENEDGYSIDISALGALLPSPNFPWRGVAGVYGQTIAPVYKSIQNMLNDDLENVARLMYELEPLAEEANTMDDIDERALSPMTYPCYTVNTSSNRRRCVSLSPPPILRRKRRRSASPIDHPLLIPSSHPSAPSILITPCASTQESSSWVPLQDAAFGNKLVVPGYTNLNSSFPPHAPVARPGHVPLVEKWTWKGGHWWAVVPDIETQVRRGWFSRPVSLRRRAARPCRTVLARNSTPS